MKVTDILEHFLSRADWIDRDTTVDRVIAGDPNADVDRCRVTWMPGMVSMTKYINDHVEGLQAELLPHGSMFRLVGAERSEG